MLRLASPSLFLGAVALLLGVALYFLLGADNLPASDWPQATGALLAATYDAWRAYRPWVTQSINNYTAVDTYAIPFAPVPTAALWLALSLLFYGVLLAICRTKRTFDWHVVGGVTLACWISLDAFWQIRLLHQLIDTHHQFFGKSPHEKLAAAQDGELYAFISRGLARVESPSPRFFLGTSDDYLGVRGSYHLYPGNVFWKRHGPELPDTEYLRTGDFIVIVRPSTSEYHRRENLLCWPESGCINAEPILVEHAGGFFRVR
jgi:hypothetical protein